MTELQDTLDDLSKDLGRLSKALNKLGGAADAMLKLDHDGRDTSPKTITVEVRGGCVVDVHDLPECWVYQVEDHD